MRGWSSKFRYEHDVEGVKRFIAEQDIRYAVPIDNGFSTWNRHGKRYWAAMHSVDKRGIIRSVRIGEGGYQETERLIQTLSVEKR